MIGILKNLIAAKSVSPQDAGLMDYISSLLSSQGFECFIKEFGEGEEKTVNLYAEKGSVGKNLCFVGHIDIVPAGDESLWQTNPFIMHEKDGKIYGRGAVDMKGAVSCMLKALIDYSKTDNGKVSLLLTSDEEASARYGTQKMLKWIEETSKKIDFAIVGEPTCSEKMGDTIKIGRRGSINFELIILGKQGHVAYPELAINPNSILVEILARFKSYKIDDGNECFQPSNLEITSIDVGNKATNIIPSKACAKFNVRCNNIKTAEEIIEEIKKIIESVTDRYELKTNISARSFKATISEFTKDFQQIVEKNCNILSEFSTSGGTSDARFVKDYCPLLEFGLLNKTAHQIDEHTEISDLQKLYTVYYEAIKSYHKSSREGV